MFGQRPWYRNIWRPLSNDNPNEFFHKLESFAHRDQHDWKLARTTACEINEDQHVAMVDLDVG